MLNLVSASYGIGGNNNYGIGSTTTSNDIISAINYSTVSVNDSQFLRGYNWETNPYFKFWYNYTGTFSQSYTNIVMTNQSNTINGNLTITAGNYYYGQPLTGMLGSGIIWANGTNNFAEVIINCTGLSCEYSNFKVRLVNTSNIEKYCDIPRGIISATDNTHNVFYVDNNCAVQKTTIQTYIQTPISPGGIADFGNVVMEGGNPYNPNGIGLENKRIIKLRKLLLQSTGKHLSIINGGFNLQQNATGLAFNITSGQYVYLMDIISSTHQNTNIDSVEVISHTGVGTWQGIDQANLNISTCDSGTGTSACSNPTRYRRTFIFMIGYNETADQTQIHQLLPLESKSYVNIANCLDIQTNPVTYTLPTFYEYSAVPLYAYCAKATDTTWKSGQLLDLRGSSGGGGGSITDTSNFVTYTGATSNTNTGVWNITANWFFGNISWNSLLNFPVACPSGTFVTNISGTITCTSVNGVNASWNESQANNRFLNLSGTNANQNINIGNNNFTNSKSINVAGLNYTLPSGQNGLIFKNQELNKNIGGFQTLNIEGTGNSFFFALSRIYSGSDWTLAEPNGYGGGVGIAMVMAQAGVNNGLVISAFPNGSITPTKAFQVNMSGTTLIKSLDVTSTATDGYRANGALGGIFVSRGDFVNWDFTNATLSTNGSTNSLDLSGIVPVGAKQVLLGIEINDDAVGNRIIFAGTGQLATTRNRFAVRTQVSGVSVENQGVIRLDSNRKIEYTATSTSFTTLNVGVMGWYI